MTGEKKRVELLPGTFHVPDNPNERPYLIGAKCPKCDCVSFPKRVVCPRCFNREGLLDVPLGRAGKIGGFGICHAGPPEYHAPYAIAYVDLAEGVRIFSQITGVEPVESSLAVGDEVELSVEKMYDAPNGDEVIGYRFKKV